MNTVKSILLILMPVWLLMVSESSYGRHAAIMIDADNGSVLHEVNATHSWYPASLTKVMTLYMAFDALKAGQIHLYDTLRASYHASRQPNSKLGLRQGETLTVQDAILAIITRSANDAAVVLAEHLGGTEESFAVKMTTKAHALGMYDTHFMNATGLPHQWQVTTSRDMAILAWMIQRNFPDYYPYFSAHSFNYKGRELRGINKFTASYPGAEGMKTGFTCGSGYNLISAASQNGKRLIGVIMGGMTSAERYQLMINMMDDGFANRFNPYPARNINTMTTSSAGTPPYQLGCGNMAPTTIGSNDNGDSYNDKPKLISKSKRINKTRHMNNRKNVKNAKHISKSKTVSKAKTASKKKVVSKTKSRKTRYRHA
jgi:D-alanyl-D-alanine carboxypeptidase